MRLAALTTAILLNACGGSDNDNASSGSNSSPPSTPTNPATTYLVSTSAGNGGTISPSIRANEGSTANLTVTPHTGFSMSGVSGCGGALSGNIYTTGPINADCTVNATFSINPVMYTVTSTAGNGGSITSGGTVAAGATTSLTVTPDSGYSIANVGGCNGTLTGNTYTTGAINANCTVNATFALVPPPGGSVVPNDDLPKHALVGYWHNFPNPAGAAFRIASVADVWDVIVVAFADDAGNGNVAFNLVGNLNKAQFIADVAAKRAAGKIVVLSFGGQNGTVTLNNASNVTNFVNSTIAIMDEYGFDGIDIDLESGAGVTHGAPVINNMISAVNQLQAHYGENFYLSMAPEHPYVQGAFSAYAGIWGAYMPIVEGLRNELDLIHVQLYNNGGLNTPYGTFDAGTVDMMVASAKMLIEGFDYSGGAGSFTGLRSDQVGLGLPSGPSSAGSGHATTANINKAVDCITSGINCGTVTMNSNQPTFRGVMTWSINWDVFDGGIFSGPVGNHLHNNLP